MKISIILIDWSVRQSFHAIKYLNDQTVDRSQYELIWVEYFSRRVPGLEEAYEEGQLNRYIILGNPPGDYSKHLAWNCGVAQATGDIVVLCDSDAMFKETFIQSILEFFNTHEKAFLMMDEIRNTNPCFWPFSYPTWAEVMATPGLLNWDEKNGVTKGLAPENRSLPISDRFFLCNYGACLCVRREDYIRYGGLDEHETYIGFICGPYDLTARLINAGLKEHWHLSEFLMHTYHPWIKPEIDRMGPHVRHNSTTSLKYLGDGTIMPIVENNQIRNLRIKMFPEENRFGTPFISVLVVDADKQLAERLYDSVQNAIKYSFEVIFISKEEFEVNREYVQVIKVTSSIRQEVLDGLKRAKGQIAFLVPPQSIFNRRGMDAFIEEAKDGEHAVYFLNVLETCTSGYIWNLKGQCFKEWSESPPLLSIGRKALEVCDFNEILKNGKVLTEQVKSIQICIWNEEDAETQNPKIESIVDELLEMVSLAQGHQFTQQQLDAAKELLYEILQAENKTVDEFFRYVLFRCKSLLEFYCFVGIFRNSGRVQAALEGLQFIAHNAVKLITDDGEIFIGKYKVNKKYNDVLYKYLRHDIQYFIGSSFFHMGSYAVGRGDKGAAFKHLQKCLEFIPDHREASRLLMELESKNT